MIESETHLYNNTPQDKNMFVFYLIFFGFYVFVLLTFIIQSILWAKIYDLVVHKTNETKKNKQKIKQDFDSRNKEKKAIRSSTQRRTQRKNEAMDAARRHARNSAEFILNFT